MNKQTKICTVASAIAFILLCIKTFTGIDIQCTEEMITAIATIIVVGGTWACSHWFNQDFTEVSAKHTGKMRAEKAAMKEGYVGEDFESEGEEIDEEL